MSRYIAIGHDDATQQDVVRGWADTAALAQQAAEPFSVTQVLEVNAQVIVLVQMYGQTTPCSALGLGWDGQAWYAVAGHSAP